MIIKSLSVSALALLGATAASAQGVEYLSYGAEFTNLSANGNSVDIFTLSGSVDYRMNNAFINGGISYTDISEEDDSLITISVRGGYFVTPDAAIYGGLNYAEFDGDDFTAYNLGGEYSFGAITVGLNYDDSDDAGYEATTTLIGSYRVNDAMEVAVAYSDYDSGSDVQLGFDYDDGTYDIAALLADLDGVTIFGVDGSYDLGNSFRVNGGFAEFDGDATSFSIGAGYEVSQDLWIDLDFGQLDLDGDNIDVISFGVTYELGDETLLIDRAQAVQVDALGVLGTIAGIGS